MCNKINLSLVNYFNAKIYPGYLRSCADATACETAPYFSVIGHSVPPVTSALLTTSSRLVDASTPLQNGASIVKTLVTNSNAFPEPPPASPEPILTNRVGAQQNKGCLALSSNVKPPKISGMPQIRELPIKPILEIVNPHKYRIPESALNQAIHLPISSDINPLYECGYYFPKENPDEGEPDDRCALLAMKNGAPVGVLLGIATLSSPCYEVHHLAVRSAERSSEGRPSTDKVGTMLMLKAMKKAQKLGKKFLKVSYKPGRGEDVDEHCKRRVAFYNSFAKFQVRCTHDDRDYYDDDYGYCRTRTTTYDLSTFNYAKAMEILKSRPLYPFHLKGTQTQID